MSTIRCASVVAFALIATSAASAGVVDITYSGIASGSWLTGIYAGQTFTNKAFSIHSSYLTDAITTYSQGYLYSRPIPPEQLEAILRHGAHGR